MSCLQHASRRGGLIGIRFTIAKHELFAARVASQKLSMHVGNAPFEARVASVQTASFERANWIVGPNCVAQHASRRRNDAMLAMHRNLSVQTARLERANWIVCRTELRCAARVASQK